LLIGAGSAYSLLNNNKGLRVGLFDKKHFSYNKPYGDASCAPSLSILEEMDMDVETNGERWD